MDTGADADADGRNRGDTVTVAVAVGVSDTVVPLGVVEVVGISVGVATGCVLGVFRPAMMIPATTTATTTMPPKSAQAQPCGPRRVVNGVVVVCGVPLLFVFWCISGLPFRGEACGPSVGGVLIVRVFLSDCLAVIPLDCDRSRSSVQCELHRVWWRQ